MHDPEGSRVRHQASRCDASGEVANRLYLLNKEKPASYFLLGGLLVLRGPESFPGFILGQLAGLPWFPPPRFPAFPLPPFPPPRFPLDFAM